MNEWFSKLRASGFGPSGLAEALRQTGIDFQPASDGPNSLTKCSELAYSLLRSGRVRIKIRGKQCLFETASPSAL